MERERIMTLKREKVTGHKVVESHPQVTGGWRYLVEISGREVIVNEDRSGALTAFVRGHDPANASDLRNAACKAVR